MDTLIPNDQPAPAFTLTDLEGRQHSLSDSRGRVRVLHFWSAECPHATRAAQQIVAYQAHWGEQVVVLNIAPNANEPPDLLRNAAKRLHLSPVLVDSTQQAANLYGAATTPHLFVVDAEGILRYQGALDDVSFRQRTPTQEYLRQAVEAVLSGRRPDPSQTALFGCYIVRQII